MRLCVCSILIILLTLPIHATTVKWLDLEGLILAEDIIVGGQVRGANAYWSSDGRLILTRHIIQVDETIKGVVEGMVEIITIGGGNGVRTTTAMGVASQRKSDTRLLNTNN